MRAGKRALSVNGKGAGYGDTLVISVLWQIPVARWLPSRACVVNTGSLRPCLKTQGGRHQDWSHRERQVLALDFRNREVAPGPILERRSFCGLSHKEELGSDGDVEGRNPTLWPQKRKNSNLRLTVSRLGWSSLRVIPALRG